VSDNTWTESGITLRQAQGNAYSNAPAIGSQLGAWTTVDMTSYITGNGTYNFAFSTTSSTNISFSSREGANAPQLVIQTASGPTNTPTATATPGPSPTATKTPTGAPTVTPTTSGSFSNATFIYDGDGKRVKSIFNSTITTYFVGNYYEVSGSTVTKYYYAGTQRIALRSNGVVNYLLGDHLGSTTLTTSATGTVISELRYKAWGEVRYASGTTPTKYTFTGQYSYTADFGLMFYNARWYDSSLGRFAQADSIIPQGQGVQAWDRYAYSNNSPIMYSDPSGHCIICLGIVILGGVGTGILASHLLGFVPDYKGIGIAEKFVTEKNAIVGAGIAVQSEYYWFYDTRKYAPNGEHSGIGIAQATDPEMQVLAKENPALQGQDQEDSAVAVQVMATRIQLAVNACKRCVDDTDRFIVAALAQNGSGFGINSVKSLPVNNGRINWDRVMLDQGRGSSDPIALTRQAATGMNL
jgi:RHS repeat-associated protein